MRSCYAIILAMVILGMAPIARGADYTLAELRTRLADELSSVLTLQVSFDGFANERWPYKNKGPVKWEWAIDGAKARLCQHPFFIEELGKNTEYLETFDGQTTHRVIFDPKNPTRMKRIERIAERIPITLARAYPEHVYGLNVRYLDTDLATLMDQSQATYEGEDDVDGVRCPRILLGTHSSPKGPYSPPWEYRVWLDPSHSFLPIKSTMVMKFQEIPGVVAKGRKTGRYAWQVKKFERFRDEFNQRERWFPTEVEMEENGIGNPVKATKVVFNESIPPQHFALEPQSGTEIVELKHDGDTVPATSLSGGSAAIAARRQEILKKVAEKKEKAVLSSVRIDATPKSESWASTLKWFTFLSAFALGGFYAYSRLRGS